MLSIALAQMEVICGKPQTNFETMKQWIMSAKAQGADLIVFPELCVGGYMVGDRYLDHDFCTYVDSFNEQILMLSHGIGIVWGNIRYASLDHIAKGRDGRPLRLNAVFFAHEGKWVRHDNTDRYEGFYIKHLNPDYRMFEESRYFLSALELSHYDGFDLEASQKPFVFKNQRIGLQVCEDLWSADYGHDVMTYYSSYGVDMVINVSASPWTKQKEQARSRQIQKQLDQYNIPLFVYVNQVGMANNGKNVMMFDGDSRVVTKSGIVTRANDCFSPELLICQKTDQIDCWHTIEQALNASRQNNKLLDALIYGIQRFDAQMFGAKVPWIIGLSGGLDSSISAALLVLALGCERVIAYNMQTSFNSSETITNAKKQAKALNIQLISGNISEVVQATHNVACKQFGSAESDVSGLVHENIQARLRGHMLSTFAAIHGGVICNNGNKVEVALGYCTLYGDSIGALSLLGDVTKVELFELAKLINLRYDQEIIPVRLLPVVTDQELLWDMAPSAELRDNQLDPMKWFYHDALIEYLTSFPTYGIEQFMERYLDGSLQNDSIFGRWIVHYGLDEPNAFIADLEWVMNSIAKSVFKRIQMPPILTVSRGAFGSDLKESQIWVEKSPRYEALKQRILSNN